MKCSMLGIAVTGLLLIGVGQARAGMLIPLYHPEDGTDYTGFVPVPQTYSTLIQVLNDVQVTGLAINYDPGPNNSDPGFYWSVWTSNASDSFLDRIVFEYGFVPDLGFGTYETPVNVMLQAGNFYNVMFQANNNPNNIGIDLDPTLPFVTTDGDFQILGGGFPTLHTAVPQISLDVTPVPEPSNLILIGSATLSFIPYMWRRRKPLKVALSTESWRRKEKWDSVLLRSI